MIDIANLIGRLPNTGEFQVIRKALEEISKQSVTGEEVHNYVTGTTFGFRESTSDEGERQVQLISAAKLVHLPKINAPSASKLVRFPGEGG